MNKLYIECQEELKNLADLEQIALQDINTEVDCICELLFVDAKEMQELNKTTRNIDKVTDVLSYPTIENLKDKKLSAKQFFTDMEGDKLSIGSIVICKEQMFKQAAEYGTTVERELYYLIVHGICHLLGYDHMEEQEKREMREQEEKILKAIGLTQQDDRQNYGDTK